MSSPYWKYPGIWNGRISPSYGAEHGGLVDYFYYAGSYEYFSGHVFCLGDDRLVLGDQRLLVADTPYVMQAAVDLTAVDFLYFCWKLRTSDQMPLNREVAHNELVTLKNVDSLSKGTTGPGLGDTTPIIELLSAAFVEDDAEHLVTLAGTTNNGTHRISGIPMNTKVGDGRDPDGRITEDPITGEIANGRAAVVEMAGMVAGSNPVATATMLGLRWRARASIDTNLRVELTEEKPGRSYQHNYLTLHCSKCVGVHDIRFDLILETV